jgi:hypothetical protein
VVVRWHAAAVHTVQGLRRAPEPGHYTAERALGDQAFVLFDQMAEGTVLTLVIVFRPPPSLEPYRADRARGPSARARNRSLRARPLCLGRVRNVSFRHTSRSHGSRACLNACSAFLYSAVTLVGIVPTRT